MMTMRQAARNYSIVFFILLCFPSFLICQDVEKVKDFEARLSVKTTKEFDKNVNLSIEVHSRLFEYSQTYSEVGISYEAFNFFTIGSDVRFKFIPGGQTGYRLSTFIELEAGKKDFDVYFQLKYQANFVRTDEQKKTIRNEFGAKYEINKRWKTGTSVELFISQNDEIYWFRKIRWTVSARHKFSKMHYLSFYYGVDRQNRFDEDDQVEITHIVGTKYDIKW